jgi:DNA mismatch repair protein MutS2
VIAALKAKAAAIASAPRLVTTGDTGAARSEARAAVETIAGRIAADVASQKAKAGSPESHAENPQPRGAEQQAAGVSREPAAIAAGDRVIVGGLGLEATVTSVHDGTAELDVRGKRMRASLRDLKAVGGNGSPRKASPPKVSVHVELQPRETAAMDLNVIGCSVDEALSRAERFLDETLLSDQRVVRLIHGYGTGQLKRALAGFLQQHPLVARFATAPPDQGGGGVTVVELKE